MKQILFALSLTLVTGVQAAPLPPADVLAHNTVKAEFVGIRHIPCRHLTAQCPDKCDHATDVAEFKVIANLDYNKPGEYGDDKAQQGSIVYVDVKKDIEGQDHAIAKQIKKLITHDEVELTITHYYVNKNGSRYPVRPATAFKVIADQPTVALPPGDVLAQNTLVAEFQGIEHRPCYFRTADCPDKCDHASDFATFKVLENLSYEKKGEYGDEKAEEGSMLKIEVKKNTEGQDPKLREAILKLKKGAQVKMTITHVYVDKEGNRYPVRPVTSFKELPKLECSGVPQDNAPAAATPMLIQAR